MPTVLFVCTGNRFRSPIAAATFQKKLNDEGMEGWQVGSAGTWTESGLSALPSAKWGLTHLGIDLSEHRSRPVSRALLADCDLILVMERNQKEALGIDFPEIRSRLFLLSEFSGEPWYDIPDPVKSEDQSPAAFLESAQELMKLVQECFRAICSQAERPGQQAH